MKRHVGMMLGNAFFKLSADVDIGRDAAADDQCPRTGIFERAHRLRD